MASMINKFNNLASGVKKIAAPLRLSPPAPPSSFSRCPFRLSGRQEKQPLYSSGLLEVYSINNSNNKQTHFSTMSSPIISFISPHGASYQQHQQQISSTSLYSSPSVQQQQQTSSSSPSLIIPHPEKARKMHLSTSTQAPISATPTVSMDDFDLLHAYYDLQNQNHEFKKRVVERFKKAGIMKIADEDITEDNIEQLLIAEELDEIVGK